MHYWKLLETLFDSRALPLSLLFTAWRRLELGSQILPRAALLIAKQHLKICSEKIITLIHSFLLEGISERMKTWNWKILFAYVVWACLVCISKTQTRPFVCIKVLQIIASLLYKSILLQYLISFTRKHLLCKETNIFSQIWLREMTFWLLQ